MQMSVILQSVSAIVKICRNSRTVHAYDGILGIVSRAAGQVVLLLCAERSVKQAPISGNILLTPT